MGATQPNTFIVFLQIFSISIQLLAIIAAGIIAYVSFRAMFFDQIGKAEELTRKLALRLNEADFGTADPFRFIDAYVEWLSSPAVLFFLKQLRHKVHEELGGTNMFKIAASNLLGTKARLLEFMSSAKAIRKELNDALDEKANWGKGKFPVWLFNRHKTTPA